MTRRKGGRRGGGKRNLFNHIESGSLPPLRDLGPAADASFRIDPLEWTSIERAMSESPINEEVELAGILAEVAVQSVLRARTERGFRGVSAVRLSFFDTTAVTLLWQTNAVRFLKEVDEWYLVRRWADADGDGGLDEEMCGVVADHMNAVYVGRLRASVVTWIMEDPP